MSRTALLCGLTAALLGVGVVGAQKLAERRSESAVAVQSSASSAKRPAGSLLRVPTQGFYAPSQRTVSRVEALLAQPELSRSRPPESLFARSDALPQDRECVGRGPDRFHEFYFTRAIYSSYGRRGGGFGGRNSGGGSWAVDYPKADCQFITVIRRLAGLDIFDDSNAINLDDSRVRNFPFLYALEVGGMSMTDAEVEGLKNYLAAGGFLVIDDFWGTYEWRNFEQEIARVLPGRPILELPMDHEVFHIFYDLDEVLQVPNVRNGYDYARGCRQCTSEQDGVVPHVRGMFDDKGRLMVLINWNTDMGDAWEWAEDPFYPLEFSTYAFRMGVNMILYSMTH